MQLKLHDSQKAVYAFRSPTKGLRQQASLLTATFKRPYFYLRIDLRDSGK